ncbi:MAG: TraB/GumN family protein [Opitutaceae bacterium]
MTRPLAVLLATLLFVAGLSAESSVWKVSRNGRTLYLGGTCHYLRAADLPLPPEFDAAFAQAAVVCLETDLAQLQSADTQQRLLAQALYTDGTKLSDSLSPEAWRAVQAWAGKAGLPAAQLQSFKPWMVMMTIMGVELQRLNFTPEGVDQQLQKKAVAARKRLSQLETVEEQIGFLTSLGAGQESELLVATLADLARLPAVLGETVAAWRVGDLEKLDATLSAEMRRDYPRIYATLIANRNKAWLPKLEAMLASEPKEFVLVGAAHLAGGDGLIALLRKKGCTIEAVPAPAGR